MVTFNYLWEQVKHHKKEVIIANILAIIVTLISVPIPLFIPALVDEVLLKKEGWLTNIINYFTTINNPVYYILIVFIVIVLLRYVNLWIRIYKNAILNQVIEDIRLTLRKKILNHLQRVSMSEYDTLGSGAISSKMSVDIGTVLQMLSGTIGEVAEQMLRLIGVSIILLYLNWKLALIVLVIFPTVIWFFKRVFKKVAKILREKNIAHSKFTNSLTESLELFNQIRVQNREKHFIDKITKDATEIKDKTYEYQLNSNKSISTARIYMTYATDLFQMLAIYFTFLGEMTIGEMMAIFVYAGMLTMPIFLIMNFIKNYHDAKEGMNRLNEILALKKEKVYKQKINPFKGKETASIELKNVTFGYDEDRVIFKDFNLKIEAGEKVAIIGQTGSGKSTLANIIMGLYEVKEGEILYNGVDIKEIGYELVRENIGFVLQAPLLFNDTLRYNLTIGKEQSEEEIYKTLKIAQLYDFVMELPDKLDTIVGKNGTKLSGGQRQRLSIARVILDKPKVLIFDESTSSLDTNTEDKLLEALDEYIKNKTVITIAHRKSTIDKAERVINLEEYRKMQI